MIPNFLTLACFINALTFMSSRWMVDTLDEHDFPAPPLKHTATPHMFRWLVRSVLKPVTACDENILITTDSNSLKLPGTIYPCKTRPPTGLSKHKAGNTQNYKSRNIWKCSFDILLIKCFSWALFCKTYFILHTVGIQVHLNKLECREKVHFFL